MSAESPAKQCYTHQSQGGIGALHWGAQPLTFTLNHGKFNEAKCKISAAVIDTDAYCVLRSMHFIAGVGDMVDSWGGNFHYRYQDAEGEMQLATFPATCHARALPLVAYAFFQGLVSSLEELLDSVDADDDTVPMKDLGPNPAPMQLAAIQV